MRRKVILQSGVEIDYLNFDNTPIHESDLYRGVCGEHRYLNAIPVPLILHLALCADLAKLRGYSIAEVAACAAHDLHEVYFRDLPTGLKDLCPDYARIEKLGEASVFRRLNLDGVDKSRIKHIDSLALIVEATYCRHTALSVMIAEGHPTPNEQDFRVFLTAWNDRDDQRWDTITTAIRAHTTDGIVWDQSIELD